MDRENGSITAVTSITSRKNEYIRYLRDLAKEASFRKNAGEFVCDSPKLLQEALTFGAEITSVLRRTDGAGTEASAGSMNKNGNTDKKTDENAELFSQISASVKQYSAPRELFEYASPMVNSPGPVFTVKLPEQDTESPLKNAVVLENVQDPGNVGTVIRTANAFGTGAVILTGDCADLYSPKTVRSTMGALFRQRVICISREELPALLGKHGLKLYGAVLSDRARSIMETDLSAGCAVAVGNEGRGLSAELRALCDGELIIPMEPMSESLNAAVAASVIMWEMKRRRDGNV